MCLREVPGATGARFVFCFVLRHPPDRKKKCVARAAHGGGSGRYRTGRMEKKCQRCNNTTKNSHTDRFGAGITTAVAEVVVWPGVGAGYFTTTTKHGRIGVGDSSLYCTYNTAWLRVECCGSPVCSRRNLTIHPGK
jgi:hypothetical protein